MSRRIKKTLISCVFFVIHGLVYAEAELPAVDFSGVTLDGTEYVFQSGQMQKPLLAVFWASWCRECRYEFHELKKLHADTRDRLDIYGISVDKHLHKAIGMSRRAGLPYPSLFDPKAKIAKLYKVRATPTLILIGGDGNIRYTGHRLNSEFYQALEKTLSAS